MELIDVITSKENLNRAYKKVAANKGAGGVDGMKVGELYKHPVNQRYLHHLHHFAIEKVDLFQRTPSRPGKNRNYLLVLLKILKPAS